LDVVARLRNDHPAAVAKTSREGGDLLVGQNAAGAAPDDENLAGHGWCERVELLKLVEDVGIVMGAASVLTPGQPSMRVHARHVQIAVEYLVAPAAGADFDGRLDQLIKGEIGDRAAHEI